MKSIKKMVALAALTIATAVLWAAPRPEQEFDQEAQEYKEYWFESVQKHKDEKNGRLLLLDDLQFFCEQHPQCLLSRVDFATESLKLRQTDKFIEQMKVANKIIPTVPQTEEGKFAKAKFYRVSAEARAMVPGYKIGVSPENQASFCIDNNELLGTQAYYTLANYYTQTGDYSRAGRIFLMAHNHDKDYALTERIDIENFSICCAKQGGGLLFLKPYLMKLFESKVFRYCVDLGAIAASAFEKLAESDKAALVAILDKEYTDFYNETSADKLIEILKKNYTTASAVKCIAFIEKFYDKNYAMSEADLKALPEKLRGFLPVRYMYKMKTSDDIAALRAEFEPFFSTIGNFYKRLYQKAEKNADKKSAAELQKIIAEKFTK
ncbi:MAG: hypothetical protein IK015_02275 [Treponema sp.]|nr:hypothetical protein [Treponema sp.]